MTKTIEEAAKDYAYDIGNSDWERMLLQDAFMDGAAYIMQLPLSDRLTAEEKERVRKEYWRAARDWIGIGDARGYCRTCIALESIFGADFFKEGE